jgi:hypothetical protein
MSAFPFFPDDGRRVFARLRTAGVFAGLLVIVLCAVSIWLVGAPFPTVPASPAAATGR